MNRNQWIADAARLQAEDRPFALVTVLRAQAPTSAKAGDKALVTADGQIHGWIGGGCAQPAVIKTVRRALRLRKRDKIQYVIRPSGEVVLTRASDAEADDPVLGQFLGFLAHDIATHPERLQSMSSSFVHRVQSLVGGVEVDLNAPLSADDE